MLVNQELRRKKGLRASGEHGKSRGIKAPEAEWMSVWSLMRQTFSTVDIRPRQNLSTGESFVSTEPMKIAKHNAARPRNIDLVVRSVLM